MTTVEALLADDAEWGMMAVNHTLKGKGEIIPWLKAGATSQKEPVVINDLAIKEWGVFEYWNIGTFTEELLEFGRQQGWLFPGDPNSLVGRRYKVAQCFVYHINAEGKIDLMRQYLDTGSVWAQFR
jgi:hypothetical protein